MFYCGYDVKIYYTNTKSLGVMQYILTKIKAASSLFATNIDNTLIGSGIETKLSS